eukprot:TRINITY_DN7480_c0_g1_i2.p1 TRINITY_DN7480_c0_g1~~TRINITY_DN7480_c0_g1_i2.p1  ORF type:complete len:195 (-),score=67.49 TRINITY_DN7480_c0_g1_i2:110-616(-)
MGIQTESSRMAALSLVSVFLIGLISGGEAADCSHGWIDGNPYDLGCLLFDGSTTYTWNDAQEFCHTQEACSLVEISNQEQQDFLAQTAYQLESFTGQQRHWFIGATDVGTEGRWFWPTSLKVATFTAWYGSEPNSGTTANYAYMHYNYDFEWVDGTDTGKVYPICQKI